MIATKKVSDSPTQNKYACCLYKTSIWGERSESVKSFSGDQIQTAYKIDTATCPLGSYAPLGS